MSKPAAVDALTPDASYQASQGSEGLKSGLWVSLIRDTANLGLLRDTDFNPAKGTYGWLDNDARTIDQTGTDPATVHSEMVDWTNKINSSTQWASERDPNIPAVADNMHTCLVCEAINMAVRNCPLRKGRTIFHSDRGRQYISDAFTQHRKGYGMARIKQDRCGVV